ncbi:hypothetical protein ACETK8_09635 [Brevundimonas staleyi]|uniref:Uncharacterized protein n=1 Tax=Brevundimonas staleyi TaxID=74326 RepID=A0ABW0FP17_9CAUL
MDQTSTPDARRRNRLRRRFKTPRFRHGLGLMIVGGGMAAAAMIRIQDRYGLYSSSMTMTLIGTVMAGVILVVLALLAGRRYGWAWGVALIAPPVLYFAALKVLEAHPPQPPIG